MQIVRKLSNHVGVIPDKCLGVRPIFYLVVILSLFHSCQQPNVTALENKSEGKDFFQLKDSSVVDDTFGSIRMLDAKHGFKNLFLGKKIKDFHFNPEEWNSYIPDSSVRFEMLTYKAMENDTLNTIINGVKITEIELFFNDSTLFSIDVKFNNNGEKGKILEVLESSYGQPTISDRKIHESYNASGYKIFKTALNKKYFSKTKIEKDERDQMLDYLDSLINSGPRARMVGSELISRDTTYSQWVSDSTELLYLNFYSSYRNYKKQNDFIVDDGISSHWSEFFRISKVGSDKLASLVDKQIQFNTAADRKEEIENKMLKEAEKL